VLKRRLRLEQADGSLSFFWTLPIGGLNLSAIRLGRSHAATGLAEAMLGSFDMLAPPGADANAMTLDAHWYTSADAFQKRTGAAVRT